MRSLLGKERITNTHSGPAASSFGFKPEKLCCRVNALLSLASTALLVFTFPFHSFAGSSNQAANVIGVAYSQFPKEILDIKKNSGVLSVNVQKNAPGFDQGQFGWSDLPEWKGLPDTSFSDVDDEGVSNETANQVAQALYDKAYTKFLVGDLDTAEQGFQRIVLHYAHSPIAHKAQIAIGKVRERRQVMFRLPSSSVEQWSSNSRLEEFTIENNTREHTERQAEDKSASMSTASLSKGTKGDFINNVGDRVFFNDRSARLTPEARFLLRAQAEWLKANKSYNLVIEGHADEDGSQDYNMTLSANRAASVERFFLQANINPSRIKTRHFGRRKKIAICEKEACSMQNRRVVTRLVLRDKKN